MYLCNLAQARLELQVGGVEDAAVGDVQAVVVCVVDTLGPPEPVSVVLERVRPRRLQLVSASVATIQS